MPIPRPSIPPGAALPAGILLLAVPLVAVGQFRGIALAATIGFAAVLAGHLRAGGRLARPGRTALLALLPLLWCLVSAAWAPAPALAATTALVMGGFILLGSLACGAVSTPAPGEADTILRRLAWGLGIAILLALLDHLVGGALRAGIRGMRDVPGTLSFSLKPAVSTLAVLLPVVPFLRGIPRAAQAALVLGGLLTAFLLPAESAKIAIVAGLLAAGAAAWIGPRIARAIGAVLAVGFLAAPVLVGAMLPRLPSLETMQPSAAHRILIWDFALSRIAERPVLGWGGEAARTIPGGQDRFDAATLDRYGLTSDFSRAWFGRKEAQRLPLHTHNAPIQVWLELGGVGAALVALLMLGLGAAAAAVGPAGAGVLAAAATVGMLSYGIWQEWWIGLLLVAALALTALRRSAAPDSGAAPRPR
ncbi:O-antigen ligase family protein [Pararoseomonas indoligenes]|uniref:O-antigen ligase family protein n=1 Tax=Roseomonas indoligenes TaxID=2820811 RepID=A0A940MVS0_9PROT|nr:O-antigen ligase family protein [Pararoseomonas indoligenes]MBP0491401.1 O-antigen ligase family protein [Pararoseomonas indoligenes]